MAATSLHLLAKQALGQLDTLTFNISSVQAKAFKTGNVGFRVTTDQGTVVTFWSSTMDQVVEATDDAGNFQVIPGVSLAKGDDGSFGLIDPTKSTSIWS